MRVPRFLFPLPELPFDPVFPASSNKQCDAAELHLWPPIRQDRQMSWPRVEQQLRQSSDFLVSLLPNLHIWVLLVLDKKWWLCVLAPKQEVESKAS